MIDISVIIVNYKGWKHLEKCLQAFGSFTTDCFTFEVIVVDNCSNDGRLAEFQERFPNYQFYCNSGNNGFSNGSNLGASKSIGAYLLFLNSDIIATDLAIGGLLKTIRETPEIMILSCRQINKAGRVEQLYRFFPSFVTLYGIFRSLYRKVRQVSFDSNSAIIYPEWVSGSVVLISKSNFDRVGGWDDRYWLYYEDVDLCWRAASIGGKIAIDQQISVIHNHGGSTRRNMQTAALAKTEVVISLHVFIATHYPRLKSFVLHLLIILDFLLVRSLLALIGVPFSFIKKMKLNRLIYFRLASYYFGVLGSKSWLSPRSVKST